MAEKSPELPEAPEALKWIPYGWHHAKTNWESLVKPAVLAVLLLVGFFAYRVGLDKHGEMIEIKDERIKQLNEQIAAYKDRLQGATPDEAAKQMARLQNTVDDQQKELEQIFPKVARRLNDTDKTFLRSRTIEFKAAITALNIYYSNIGDSPLYAHDFSDLFQSIGVPLMSTEQTTCVPGEKGVMVGLKNPSNPSQRAKDFLKILSDANLNPTFTLWKVDPSFSFGNQDFDLFICGKG